MEQLGLDKPLHVQFIKYMEGLFKGDLGYSFMRGIPVIDILKRRVPNTILLGGLTVIVTVVIGIPLGIIAATRPFSIVDRLFTTISVAGHTIPNFWLGLILLLVFSFYLGLFPLGGMETIGTSGFNLIDFLRHLTLPLLTGVASQLNSIFLFVRSSMMEALKQDYITVAKGKGLDERTVFYKHALRNALLPVVSHIGLAIAFIFSGGSLVIETIFSWPGIGLLMWEALGNRDYPILLSLFLIFSIMIITVNIVMDVVYAAIDPRISYE
jgi:peptide/nickel transport system permease protein